MFSCTIRAFLLLVASAIAACGGGSGAARPSAAIQAPAASATLAFTLTPTAIKSFHFSWQDTSDETGYRLLEDPDGVSGYSPIAELPADTTGYDHQVFLPERVNARYRLQVCKAQDCVDAATVVASGDLVPAIGYVKASDAVDNQRFGTSVALSANGQFLAVGAPNTGALNGGSGAVYVFAREGTVWRQQAKLESRFPEAVDLFGASLNWSTDGGTLAVGAPGAAALSGAVFVFNREGEGWGSPVRVAALNAGPNDGFGRQIALSGDGHTLAVGAENESSDATGINGPDNDNSRQSGAAYVFTRVGGGWVQRAYIKASAPDAFDLFGRALALSADGQTLAVGAPREDGASSGTAGDPSDDTTVDAGAVYVYTFDRGLDNWRQQAYVKASNTRVTAWFGSAIALSADGAVMAVGSMTESNDARGIDGKQAGDVAERSGAVYVFARQGAQWDQTSYLKASNAEERDLFGSSVALSDDGHTLAVGAVAEDSQARGLQGDQDNNGASSSGAVYLFGYTSAGWRQRVYIKPSNTDSGGVYEFGSALALAGRRGDSKDQGLTLAVGSPYASNASSGVGGDQSNRSGSDVGAVYLY